MKRLIKYLRAFKRQMQENENVIDGSSWIQKKRLNNRYYGKEQNKLYKSQPMIDYYKSNQRY